MRASPSTPSTPSSTSPASSARVARRRVDAVVARRPNCLSENTGGDVSPSTLASRARRGTERWLRDWIVGMNLCPFARPAMTSTFAIETVGAGARESGEYARVVTREISRLMACSFGEPATTLVVFEEGCVEDWSTFMDGAVREAEVMCEEMTDGEVTVVAFHPRAAFDGESACGNYTSRSPLPTVHLLRAVDVDRAETSWYRDEDREDIRERNVEYLSALGLTELKRRFARLYGET